MMVKICGITNREDAETAIACGASALGFIFYPKSPRYVTPAQAAAIIGSLRTRVWNVGVFVDESPARVAQICAQADLDVAQLHGEETPAAYPPGMRIWKARRVGAHFDVGAHGNDPAEALLLDGPASGVAFDWNIAAHAGKKVILAGGLDAANVREAIRTALPWGVDACSRLEISPGKKDPVKLEQFLKAALG
jgi:phosphoribosylanthranilate isomerase